MNVAEEDYVQVCRIVNTANISVVTIITHGSLIFF